jgi:hypothetical protein
VAKFRERLKTKFKSSRNLPHVIAIIVLVQFDAVTSLLPGILRVGDIDNG